MQKCHGKRSCSISPDISTFGNPCRPASRMYLKVVYTCGKLPYIEKRLIFKFTQASDFPHPLLRPEIVG